MKSLLHRIGAWAGHRLASLLPSTVGEGLVSRLGEKNLGMISEILGPRLNREKTLDNMPFDLPVNGEIKFEHLSGLFTSSPFNHGVISMTVRQAAYLFGLIRQRKPKRVIEIGRYKGGSTFLIAAAMKGEGMFWSIDNQEKAERLFEKEATRPFDTQLENVLKRFSLKAELVVGDSRTVEIETGEVDLVLIDGDHAYPGVKNDFERFGKRVRVGGAVLFDDAFDEGIFKAHTDTVGHLVQEIVASGEFRLVKAVNRLAHLERMR